MAPLWRHYGANHTFWEKNTGIFELPTSFPITFTINFFSHNVYFGLHLQKNCAYGHLDTVCNGNGCYNCLILPVNGA